MWHLYQAALAGRDIYYDQRYRHNLEMRDLLEALVTHEHALLPADPGRGVALHQAVLAEQRRLQQPHRPQVRAAPQRGRAGRGGGSRGPRPAPRCRPAAGRVGRPPWPAGSRPSCSTPRSIRWSRSKTPGPGGDILRDSANNLYAGVTDGRSRRLRGALPAQLAAGQAGRPAGRGGVSHRRPLRRRAVADRALTSRRRFRWPRRRSPRPWRRWSSGIAPAKTRTASRSTSPGSRPPTRPWTR